MKKRKFFIFCLMLCFVVLIYAPDIAFGDESDKINKILELSKQTPSTWKLVRLMFYSCPTLFRIGYSIILSIIVIMLWINRKNSTCSFLIGKVADLGLILTLSGIGAAFLVYAISENLIQALPFMASALTSSIIGYTAELLDFRTQSGVLEERNDR